MAKAGWRGRVIQGSRSPEPAKPTDSEAVAEAWSGVVVDVVLDRIVARDPNLLGLHLLGAAGIATSHAELGNPHRIALDLELVSRRIILRILADATRIAEPGRLIIVVIPRIGVRIMVDDAAALLGLIRLGPDMVRYPQDRPPGPVDRVSG